MMDVYSSRRKRFVLGPERGHGGEATVYLVQNEPALLAKVYTPEPRRGYDGKLAWMLANPPADPGQALGHHSIAWPHDLLYDANGRFVGFTMPHIRNTAQLLEVFSPILRTQTLPNFDRLYLHRTARNLAAALGALHSKGYVVGDLNESNVLVTPAALVSMIDADSFQVREYRDAQIVVYPCPVGKPEYTPPELQGQPFREIVRQPEHDLFGLAVLVFQLLMEGSHPYRSRWLGSGDPPPIEDKIKQGWFPYANPVPHLIAPPATRSNLDVLHPELSALILRTFKDGYQNPRLRPRAEEWEKALALAEQNLTRCRNGHYFSGHLSRCPLCNSNRAPTSNASINLLKRVQTKAVATSNVVSQTAGPATLVPLACHRCHSPHAPTEIYCQSCAEPLQGTISCSHCKHLIPLRARYCTACGRQV